MHGTPPYEVAVIHGGPGAPGSAAPLARELSDDAGVLEPFQTAMTVDGQVGELHGQIAGQAKSPVTIIGWSWGAWLALLLAARYPDLVGKLILVGCGPFEKRYAEMVMSTRLSRLGRDDRSEALSLIGQLNGATTPVDGALFARFGALMEKADTYEPLGLEGDVVEFQPEVNKSVWAEAQRMREDGSLLDEARTVRCPVVALHGDYDSHPYEGVKGPLSRSISTFKFVLLSHCGHTPWNERYARDRFFALVRQELP
jgi:pimeloyl-ACP methyl ester carboxylesterase